MRRIDKTKATVCLLCLVSARVSGFDRFFVDVLLGLSSIPEPFSFHEIPRQVVSLSCPLERMNPLTGRSTSSFLLLCCFLFHSGQIATFRAPVCISSTITVAACRLQAPIPLAPLGSPATAPAPSRMSRKHTPSLSLRRFRIPCMYSQALPSLPHPSFLPHLRLGCQRFAVSCFSAFSPLKSGIHSSAYLLVLVRLCSPSRDETVGGSHQFVWSSSCSPLLRLLSFSVLD